MMLRKYMSLLGIGSASIDLILEKDIYEPGESVTGTFFIKGGTIEQQIKRVECDLVVTDKTDKSERLIETATIYTSKLIDSEEANQIPFSLLLPKTLDASTDTLLYRFKTRMFFNEGVKSEDQDTIQIVSKNTDVQVQ